MEILNNILRKTGFQEYGLNVLNDCGCLWRRLENYRISSKQSGYQRVNQDQVWVL